MAIEDFDDDSDDVQTLNIDSSSNDPSTTGQPKPDRGDDFTPDEGAPAPGNQATDDAADAGKTTGADQRIPKARFDEVNEARKNAERALAEANAQIQAMRNQGGSAPAPAPAADPPQPAFDVQAKEKEYLDLLMEGETDKATQIRMEINKHIAEQAETAAEQRILKRAAQSELSAVSNKIVEDWPYLDTPAGKSAIELIVFRRHQYEQQGLSPAAALQRAANELAPKLAPDDAETPTRDGTGSTDNSRQTDTRRVRAVERGIKDSQAQPPTLSAGVGNRQQSSTGALNVETMDEEQFARLTTAEKRKLRGD